MKNKVKRVFLIVLDGFGIGASRDAARFGDDGANTLKSVYETKQLHIPHLLSLGLGHIDGVECPTPAQAKGIFARLSECSGGKDTTVGHWEMVGAVTERAFPTYPNGFPRDLLLRLENAVGRKTICNRTYSGTEVIRDYGKEHMETGSLIVYTSADSVCQIAAHEAVVPVEELYGICQKAREIFEGPHAVGRIIARPFDGEYPNFYRTAHRRDFSLKPPENTLLHALSAAGFSVIGVGKIEDIFAGQGLTRSIHTSDNADGMRETMKLLDEDFTGLAFVNLVDFDMVYGHRRDAFGYAHALNEFDKFLGAFILGMKEADVLMITSDHGTDPAFMKTTDHTREDVPFLAFRTGGRSANGGHRQGFYTVGDTVADLFGISLVPQGRTLSSLVSLF